MMRTFLILCAAIYLAWGQEEEETVKELTILNWKRNVRGRNVQERAYIFHSASQIRMESDIGTDQKLRGVYHSVSFHDYNAQRPTDKGFPDGTGLVALKFRYGREERCAITATAEDSDFDSTYIELVRRSGLDTPERLPLPKHSYEFLEGKIENLESFSPTLASFCERAEPYWLAEEPYSIWRWWWPWLICLYVPYPIFIPWYLPIY